MTRDINDAVIMLPPLLANSRNDHDDPALWSQEGVELIPDNKNIPSIPVVQIVTAFELRRRVRRR